VDGAAYAWTTYQDATPKQFAEAEAADPAQTQFVISWPRTVGLWIAAFFTLCIFSFLWRDNPLYKLAESVVIGVSAAYWMVVAVHTTVFANLIGKLWPAIIKASFLPGLEGHTEWSYLVPLILGGMLLWRLAPKGGWIARWPLAFIIGTTAGLRLVSYLKADFMSQIRNAIEPIIAMPEGQFDFWLTVTNITMLVGVLAGLVYFFFSFEHKGIVGRTARLGIWFLMITFGAGFGYTVMGRIALLAGRLEFLFDDWLWLIDPTGKRLGM
jgi:hypothetical protein